HYTVLCRLSAPPLRTDRSHTAQVPARPQGATPFPYTTLFRSGHALGHPDQRGLAGGVQRTFLARHPRGDGAADVDDPAAVRHDRSEEHTSELQSRENLVCRVLLEKKKDEKEQARKGGEEAD